LKEYNSVFKKSTFIDNRLGENDPTLTADEKAMQRLIAERTVRIVDDHIGFAVDSHNSHVIRLNVVLLRELV
jgi:hypothetical protein